MLENNKTMSIILEDQRSKLRCNVPTLGMLWCLPGIKGHHTFQVFHVLIHSRCCCCCHITHSPLYHRIHLFDVFVVTANKILKVLVSDRFLAAAPACGVEREEAREEVDRDFTRGTEATEQRGRPANVKEKIDGKITTGQCSKRF